jgi:hypothetical protein
MLVIIYHRHKHLDLIIIIRHYATSRSVAGLIPDEVTEFFNRPNLSSRTMALGVDSVSDRNEYHESSGGGG